MDDFFQLFNWFQLFSSDEIFRKLQETARTVSEMGLLKGGVDGFRASAIFIDYTPRNEILGGYTGFTMSVRL